MKRDLNRAIDTCDAVAFEDLVSRLSNGSQGIAPGLPVELSSTVARGERMLQYLCAKPYRVHLFAPEKLGSKLLEVGLLLCCYWLEVAKSHGDLQVWESMLWIALVCSPSKLRNPALAVRLDTEQTEAWHLSQLSTGKDNPDSARRRTVEEAAKAAGTFSFLSDFADKMKQCQQRQKERS